eukprot:TRINITY_DN1462_c7_g1_i2.p1 TRINITY_DN1462_c7_g1~~TRINITY_DN1462_c7_g1_i2.p1  ORF type:complete len:346 (+),score=86.39 TRINITY_DN1462_c7_g1_i2:55-1092(+)
MFLRMSVGASRRWVSASAYGLEKEDALRKEALSWKASSNQDEILLATDEEVPVLDFMSADYPEALRKANTEIGFHLLKNHGVSDSIMEKGFKASEVYHALPLDVKMKYEMDHTPGYPGGVGYLPNNNFKLPRRVKGNLTETFIIKREEGPRDITFDKMPWPEVLGEEWKNDVLEYTKALEDLAMRMLPKYAEALKMEPSYFNKSFESPLVRLRLAYYPPVEQYEELQYGVGPHVDTTFFTILAQREPGLVVNNEKENTWRRVAAKPGTFVINTGEILRNLTNDTWLSTRHYALNAGSTPRYSIPFFFCPTSDYPCEVIPSTITPERPAKYPPTSYLDGQGVAQGE